MQLTQSSVGRKIIMAVTGIVLVAFVCVHLLGNSSLFVGADAINAYAQKLHSLGPFVWVFRLVMLAGFAIHIIFGIQLTLENRAATPEKNVQIKRLKTGFGAETMIVSGLGMHCGGNSASQPLITSHHSLSSVAKRSCLPNLKRKPQVRGQGLGFRVSGLGFRV